MLKCRGISCKVPCPVGSFSMAEKPRWEITYKWQRSRVSVCLCAYITMNQYGSKTNECSRRKLMKWNLGFTLLWRTIICGLVMNEGTTLFLPSIFSPPKIWFPLMQLQLVFCIKILLRIPQSILYTVIRTVFVWLRVDTSLLLGCVIVSDYSLADTSVFQNNASSV